MTVCDETDDKKALAKQKERMDGDEQKVLINGNEKRQMAERATTRLGVLGIEHLSGMEVLLKGLPPGLFWRHGGCCTWKSVDQAYRWMGMLRKQLAVSLVGDGDV
ncbi:hypothetical protein MMC12_008364 [Toensbergia leucococca]|nr:hypothetical protein [Toensbergia leucococca]